MGIAESFPHLPRESWEAYLDERLEGGALDAVERHLGSCPDCMAVLARADPSRLFFELRRPVPQAAWDGFWEDIAAEIRSAPRPAARRRWVLVAGIAASVTLAALVVTRVDTTLAPGQSPVAAAPADCPDEVVARLRLSPDECRALFGGGIPEDATPVLIVGAGVDLRGL